MNSIICMMCFKNTASPKETKAIMTDSQTLERTLSPVFGHALERRFWFAQDEFDPLILSADLKN